MTHTNRLIHEKSPYLLQHAHNPVDWYPWGPEAFEKARSEDKPIFLSVGYSTCYWCHVMERECFENDEIAGLLNDNFVAVKVDREERPDIDQVYMGAVQLLTGRGGWPMSVFLTSEGRPFHGGTYFPPDHFRPLLLRVADTYRSQREQVSAVADEIAAAIESMAAGPTAEGEVEFGRPLARAGIDALRKEFDEKHGGFGTAPKFPPYNALRLLFHEHRRTGEKQLLDIAVRTLDAMALGGIRDHIGGGFHRYSTDERWFLPHFEKMLYDNALLARAYVEAHVITEEPRFREVAEQTYAWVEREMMDPQGGFYSALDAESEGVEGKFYTWRQDEIISLLGKEHGGLFCRAYNVTDRGNYVEEATGRRTGQSVLYLSRPLHALEKDTSPEFAQFLQQLDGLRERLLRARDERPRPLRDDKILTAWNGLMIASLAYSGRELDEPPYIAAAARAAEFVLEHLRQEGRLLRRWRDGEARHPACLDDYMFLADGLLELHAATRDAKWLEEARSLVEVAIGDFWDDREGGFFYTATDAERLLVRPKDALDQPLPSANGVAVRVLLSLAEATGQERYRQHAERTLRALAPWLARAPHGTSALALSTAIYVDRVGGAASPGRAMV